jgi:hypothetical protein
MNTKAKQSKRSMKAPKQSKAKQSKAKQASKARDQFLKQRIHVKRVIHRRCITFCAFAP